MGRKSTKENKNIYQEARDELGWSREKAADEILKIENGRYGYVDKYKLVKIEEESIKIQPDDIVALSKAYKKPELRNHYSLESVNSNKMRLMEILADGKVDETEMPDLNKILDELEKISMTIEAIQLWCEKMKINGTGK